MAYIANTPDDVRVMLGAIGLDSLDQLFDMVPPEYRLRRPLAIPEALSELELTSHVGALAAKNQGADVRPCFLGGGSYDHFIPAVVDNLAARGEFYTAYTPYQAEASQGTLQATFEYQTLIAQLTGMDVSNASLYDGGSAVVRGGPDGDDRHPAARPGRRRRVGPPRVRPDPPDLPREPRTRGRGRPARERPGRRRRPRRRDHRRHGGRRRRATPTSSASSKTIEALVDAAQARGALAIVSRRPDQPGPAPAARRLTAPTSWWPRGSAWATRWPTAGPYLGILACREAFVRKMPGRVVGQTVDRHGKRCFVLTLQTREQHIRREKATSNICTNQGLLALRASIYLAALGPGGLRQVAELSTRKAHYAAERLAEVPGLSIAFPGPFFKEFVVRSTKDPVARARRGRPARLSRRDRPGPLVSRDGRLRSSIAVTEKRTKAEIDGLAEAYRKALATSDDGDRESSRLPHHRARRARTGRGSRRPRLTLLPREMPFLNADEIAKGLPSYPSQAADIEAGRILLDADGRSRARLGPTSPSRPPWPVARSPLGSLGSQRVGYLFRLVFLWSARS